MRVASSLKVGYLSTDDEEEINRGISANRDGGGITPKRRQTKPNAKPKYKFPQSS
jgi:hypothetical protein